MTKLKTWAFPLPVQKSGIPYRFGDLALRSISSTQRAHASIQTQRRREKAKRRPWGQLGQKNKITENCRESVVTIRSMAPFTLHQQWSPFS